MAHFYTRVLFVVGFILGIFIFFLGTKLVNLDDKTKRIPSYNQWVKSRGLNRKSILWDTLRYNHNSSYSTEADFLFTRIKVLCIILVQKEKNAKASMLTWGKGCNYIEFLKIKSKSNKLAPLKRVMEKSSWVLLCHKLKTISSDFDWVLVVNDNSFVIMENLRYYVAPLEASVEYYLGYAVMFWNTIYNSGQAGYVLSRGAIKSFGEKFTKQECSTNSYGNREDFYLGRHLASLNITPIDTRDAGGFSTFHPYNLNQLFFPGDSYYKTSVYPAKCCSKKSISFQGIEGDKMYTYYYLLYDLQIFSEGNLGNRHLPQITDDDQVWKTFLKDRNISTNNVTNEQYYKIWENLIEDPTSFAAHMKRENFDYD